MRKLIRIIISLLLVLIFSCCSKKANIEINNLKENQNSHGEEILNFELKSQMNENKYSFLIYEDNFGLFNNELLINPQNIRRNWFFDQNYMIFINDSIYFYKIINSKYGKPIGTIALHYTEPTETGFTLLFEILWVFENGIGLLNDSNRFILPEEININQNDEKLTIFNIEYGFDILEDYFDGKNDILNKYLKIK